MQHDNTNKNEKFSPDNADHFADGHEGCTKVVLQRFQQLSHSSAATIRGFANLMAHQEIPISLAIRELQEAQDELSFFHLESSKVFQAQLASKPDESFEVREIVDRAISFVTTALVLPKVDILYHFEEQENHFRTGNKAAITSLLYNFILHRIAHTSIETSTEGFPSQHILFSITSTPSGIELNQILTVPGEKPETTLLPAASSSPHRNQLSSLITLTRARMSMLTLKIPLTRSKPVDRKIYSQIKSTIICTDPARRAAISNRLCDLGLIVVDENEIADCYFFDAENQVTVKQDIDRLAEKGLVFLFNYRSPWKNKNCKPIKYPIRQSELLSELSLLASYLSRVQEERAHVMVVDDNPQNLRLVTNYLETLGVRTTSATDGVEAVTLFGEHIDLVFMDLHMPRMNGFEAAIALRTSIHPAVPIIALSADLSSDDVSEALQIGINDVHKKPIDMAIIEQALIQHIGFKPANSKTVNSSRKPSISSSHSEVLELIDIELSLARADNRPALAKEMLELLIESLPEDIEQLNTHHKQNNCEAMALIVHKIKGACCYCGVSKFEDSIKKLHVLLKDSLASLTEEKIRGVDSLVLVVNHNATNLLDLHLTQNDPFYLKDNDQDLKNPEKKLA